MTRAFAAPPALVFACLTEPDLLRQWHGADGWDLDVCEVDLRVGGAWRFDRPGPAACAWATAASTRRSSRPASLAYTERFDDQWYPGEALVVAVLEPEAGGTVLTTT